MSGCRDAVSVLLMLLVFLPVAANSASPVEPGDEDQPGHEPAMAFETLAIHRPRVVWFGTRKSRIGDYAVVTHKCCRGNMNGRSMTSDYKFSLDVATLEGGTANMNGKIHTVYRRGAEDDPGLVQDFAAFYVEDRWGISDVDIGYDGYESTFNATIVTGYQAGDTWQFMAKEQWANDRSIKSSGTLTNAPRTLNITITSPAASIFIPPEETDFHWIFEIYEDGELLCRKMIDSEYVFRVGLTPELKLVLLTGMETLAATQRGDYRR